MADKHRLLIDVHVIHFLRRQVKSVQDELLEKFEKIASYPAYYSDYAILSPNGGRYDVHIHYDFAITYWEDAADRHVKIMEITFAD